MKPIRTAIVDDEPLAREGIALLLATAPDVEVTATYDGGRVAIEGLRDDPPDLLFVDVQMPEVDGFDVLHALDDRTLPVVIFVTAYDRYALRAFDAHALDYVLKPIDEDRFAQALDRARSRLAERRAGHLDARIAALLDERHHQQETPAYPLHVVVKERDRVVFVPVDEIRYVEAAGNYTVVRTERKAYTRRGTMAEMAELLDPNRFLRIHRSTLINLGFVRELRPVHHGEYVVMMQGGAELKLARGYREALVKAMRQDI